MKWIKSQNAVYLPCFFVPFTNIQLSKWAHVPYTNHIHREVTEKIHNLHGFVTQIKTENERRDDWTQEFLKQVSLCTKEIGNPGDHRTAYVHVGQ